MCGMGMRRAPTVWIGAFPNTAPLITWIGVPFRQYPDGFESQADARIHAPVESIIVLGSDVPHVVDFIDGAASSGSTSAPSGFAAIRPSSGGGVSRGATGRA